VVNIVGAYKLFPTLVLDVECSELLPEVIDVLNKSPWKKESPSVSDSFLVLNKNRKLTKKFEKIVNDALDNIKYVVPLKMTTSWFTNILPGNKVEMHTHTNSFWSAVFYLQDSSPLGFYKDEVGVQVPSLTQYEDLVFNGMMQVDAKVGHMLIFQSHVKHGSLPNTTHIPRYSLAMNFMPDSQVLKYDSSYHYGADCFDVKNGKLNPY